MHPGSTRPLAAGLALALATSPPVAGQEPGDTARLEELTVTATRLPTAPDALVSTVTVLTGEELRARGVRFVADALRDVPGLAVVQGGSFGGVASVFVRGGESDYVKVLVDGVPVNHAGGAFNWANLTTDNVARVEVLRGPASVLYGSDAVSGVVQIFTRRGEGPIRAEAAAEAGAFGTVRWRGGVSGAAGPVGFSADLGRFTSDGIYDFNNRYRNTVASGALRTLPGRRTSVGLSARYGDSRHRFPTDFAGAPVDSNQFTDEEATAVALDLARRLGDRLDLRVSAVGSRTAAGFGDTPDSPGDTLGFAFAARRASRADRGAVDARLDGRPASGLVLTAGAQVERETERQSGESSSNFGGVATTPDTPFDRGRTTLAYYAQGILALPSGAVLNLNARVDDNSAFGTFFTYRAGVAVAPLAATRLRASVGRAFKAPTFCEQFCDAPFVVGDSTLRPERASSWELGVEQGLVGERVTIWAAYFSQRFRDLVVYDGGADPGEPTYRNGAAARARGVEAGVRGDVATLRVSASYTYLDAEATDDGGVASLSFSAGEPLIRRPRHAAQLALRAPILARATLGASLAYVGRRDDVDFRASPNRRVSLAAYATVGLAAEVELVRRRGAGPRVTATVRAENLLDERFEEVLGFPGRRRGIYAGAAVGF
jgi:vitamin B12 transporter